MWVGGGYWRLNDGKDFLRVCKSWVFSEKKELGYSKWKWVWSVYEKVRWICVL